MGLHLKTAGVVPERVYAGCLKRQSSAALIIAEQLGVEDRVMLGESALDEIDYGAWEGLTAAELKAGWPKEYADWNEASRWPEHVFAGSAEKRLAAITAWLERLRKERAAGESVVAVTSNGNIRFFCSFIAQYWRGLVAERRMKELKVGTGNYCEVQLFPDTLSVVCWNREP